MKDNNTAAINGEPGPATPEHQITCMEPLSMPQHSVTGESEYDRDHVIMVSIRSSCTLSKEINRDSVSSGLSMQALLTLCVSRLNTSLGHSANAASQ